MIDAVVVINSDATYLEDKFTSLGVKVFAFDQYQYNNLDKIQNITYLESFINNIFIDYQDVGLVYGSGLEDKPEIYDYLRRKLNILGNDPKIISECNDLRLLANILNECDLKLPEYANNPIELTKRYLSKPFNSSGGYNISFSEKYKKNCYLQEYLQGETYSISFFNHGKNFIFLGFNKLLNLINFDAHPFIHAGALTTNEFLESNDMIHSFEKLSKKLSMNGYNNIDFKVLNKEIFVLDINPRITSTFKIYNDIYDNDLLRLTMNPRLNKKLESCNNNEYVFVHMFTKQEYTFKNFFMDDPSFINLPDEGQHVGKNQPLLSIYLNSFSSLDLMMQLKEKISITTNLYNCYDIDI
jgi:predicted ATP-grasp superfamily ATP-dependent carboligase